MKLLNVGKANYYCHLKNKISTVMAKQQPAIQTYKICRPQPLFKYECQNLKITELEMCEEYKKPSVVYACNFSTLVRNTKRSHILRPALSMLGKTRTSQPNKQSPQIKCNKFLLTNYLIMCYICTFPHSVVFDFTK